MTEIKNLSASIHARLANLAKAQDRPFQEYFYYYIMERFLYRMARSPYANKFVLKGGLIFQGWGLPLRRPTRDIDVQGYLNNSQDFLIEVVKQIALQEVEPDGLFFDPRSVHAEQIIEAADYQGVRVHFEAYLGNAHQQSHIDFSFGNVITPSEILVTYPTLLEMPPFQIRGYPIETAIAEKFQIMVYWEIANDRMKDFYDIHLLSQQVEIPGKTLVDAITATFQARNTQFPDNLPLALSDEFALTRQPDWNSYLTRTFLTDTTHPAFIDVIQQLRSFLLPPMHAARDKKPFDLHWPPGGPWTNSAPFI